MQDVSADEKERRQLVPIIKGRYRQAKSAE